MLWQATQTAPGKHAGPFRKRVAGMAEKPVSAVSKKRGPERARRRKILENARISRGWAWRATMIAAIPEDVFEALLAQKRVPMASRLVELGR